jgi:hypothetical protein
MTLFSPALLSVAFDKAALRVSSNTSGTGTAARALDGRVDVGLCLKELLAVSDRLRLSTQSYPTQGGRYIFTVETAAVDLLDDVVALCFGALYGQAVADGRPTKNFEDLRDALCLGVFNPKNAMYGDAFVHCGVPGLIVRLLDFTRRIEVAAPDLRYGSLNREENSHQVLGLVTDAAVLAGMALMVCGVTNQRGVALHSEP